MNRIPSSNGVSGSCSFGRRTVLLGSVGLSALLGVSACGETSGRVGGHSASVASGGQLGAAAGGAPSVSVSGGTPTRDIAGTSGGVPSGGAPSAEVGGVRSVGGTGSVITPGAGGQLVNAGGSLGQGGWDPAWSKRRQITVNVPDLAEDLADFPVLLRIHSADLLGVNSSGHDIRLALAPSGEELSYELQSWNPSGESLLWVRMPQVKKAPVLTAFWIYYANPNANAPPADAAHNPWGTPFSGVWHLEGSAKDASPNAYDGTPTAGAAWVTSSVGMGFNSVWAAGFSPHIMLKHDINVVGGETAATLSAWVNPTHPESKGVVATFGKSQTTDHASYLDLNIDNGSLETHVDPIAVEGDYVELVSPAAPGLVPGKWSWAVVTLDLTASRGAFYLDGVPLGGPVGPAGSFNAPVFANLASNRSAFGTEEDEGSNDYEGGIDEVRIERVARSPAWIKAQYRAYVDPTFLTWGPVETAR